MKKLPWQSVKEVSIEKGSADAWIIQWRHRKMDKRDIAVKKVLENQKALKKKRRVHRSTVIPWRKQIKQKS